MLILTMVVQEFKVCGMRFLTTKKTEKKTKTRASQQEETKNLSSISNLREQKTQDENWEGRKRRGRELIVFDNSARHQER